MTNLNDVVAQLRIADLHREAAAESLARVARSASPHRDARRGHGQRQGSLARALSNHGMPLKEIRAILRTKDPANVARHMELHRERLTEQLAHRVRELEALERILTRRSRAAARR